MFCVTVPDQPVFQVSFKVTPDEYTELLERPGISPAPYLARQHWVLLTGADILP